MPTVLVAVDPDSGRVEYALDFTSYAMAPEFQEDKNFVIQQLRWASQVGNVLYVSHGHYAYARSSKGGERRLTAIDVTTRRIQWHSAPLVST